ncbi:MAG: DUF1294 domain-containing protein [Clostridiales bacterium]|uniref:Uncharacterized membrane protein YsdA (DUF1294 family) n=1 Tax=Harryflintia acetispora TaxID=1849041 RepID=A0A9X8UJ42_9FIRM|nr:MULTISPECIES: DUF1294 domain-containing protein [Oscillospiraceae]PWM38187.1 MAG: DUF1294 domain-containing protein [Clostridiales bacterium]PWM40164.1 MAG: DUF1294 domain-containing protein [Clostridiales bacterium]TCL43453.1 uncharacterized membrane protein YsdA (DUF1294 family) [Harryflintia acetispora]
MPTEALSFLWGYLVAINVTAFLAAAVDKRRAKRGRWRLPERTLWLLALLLGSAGLYFGMLVFRHKTQRPLFRFGVPALLVLQAGILLLLLGNL